MKKLCALRNFAALQSGQGELLKEIPPYLKRDFWYNWSKFWKLHCLRIMALESKRHHSKSLILVSFCRKKNVLLINALTNLI